jgi:hypothetical protein
MALYRRNFTGVELLIAHTVLTLRRLKQKLLGMIKTTNSLLARRAPIDLMAMPWCQPSARAWCARRAA